LEVSVLGNKSSILIFKLIYHITGSKSGPLDLMFFFAWFNFEMILLKFFFTLIGNSEWLLKDMHIQKCLCMEVNIVINKSVSLYPGWTLDLIKKMYMYVHCTCKLYYTCSILCTVYTCTCNIVLSLCYCMNHCINKRFSRLKIL
jgi:hypothetical protein